jgi:hypothetical protein
VKWIPKNSDKWTFFKYMDRYIKKLIFEIYESILLQKNYPLLLVIKRGEVLFKYAIDNFKNNSYGYYQHVILESGYPHNDTEVISASINNNTCASECTDAVRSSLLLDRFHRDNFYFKLSDNKLYLK